MKRRKWISVLMAVVLLLQVLPFSALAKTSPPQLAASPPKAPPEQTHKCGGPGDARLSPFYGITVKSQEEIKGVEKATTLSRVIDKDDVKNVLKAHPLNLQTEKARIVKSKIDTLHAWLALGVPVPALLRMDTGDTMVSVVVPGADEKEFLIYYEMAKPVGHFRTMAAIYRINEKTVDLVAMSVNGKPPRFGRTADGRPLQRSGDKAGPQPDDPCGGCSIWSTWEYQTSGCTSYSWGCLIGCGFSAGSCAVNCGKCAKERDGWACGQCVSCALGVAHCVLGCCQHWVRNCVSCGSPGLVK